MDGDINKELNILDNYLKNPKLRKEINGGALISVDNLIVLNDKNYVLIENNNLQLTQKGLDNIDSISYGAIRKDNERMTRLLTYYYMVMSKKYDLNEKEQNMICEESAPYQLNLSNKIVNNKKDLAESIWKKEITLSENKLIEEESILENIMYAYNSDPTFSEAVVMMMESKKLSGPDCYNRAGINRNIFSKIQRERDYIPTKSMCISLCFGMQLNSWDAEYLLRIGGYAFGNILFDKICNFFIGVKNHDVDSVNSILKKHSCIARLGSK